MKLVVNGDTPSLKNSKQIFTNRSTGKPFITSSQRSKIWQVDAENQLRDQFKGLKVSDYPISITLIFFYSTKRRHDLDNSCASVMDALVHADIIEDDNVNYIDCITLQYGGLDKTNPRVEVYIDD